MAYRDFTLDTVIQKFKLEQKWISLFATTEQMMPSAWLQESLGRGKNIAIPSGNEKARSEFIIAPIMLEIAQLFGNHIAIYSGKNLDVDRESGLTGECDFIISKGEQSFSIQTPILALVEAKKADIELGLGQCVAQMVGAKMLSNLQSHTQSDYSYIYGCITTGEDWQFMKLEAQTLYIDRDRYYINQVEKILGCFHSIIKLATSEKL
jgi:hypothetical protein